MIFFIDGIDVRPNAVLYEDYIECIKGLANAIWSVNNEIFPYIKSEGKLKIVLLIRPDIFANLGLQNQNNKIKDNSILLDWRTNYKDFETSKIYTLADRLLMAQQDQNYITGRCWDYYFPYKLRKRKNYLIEDHSFIQFLRYSLYRPRDIVTMLDFVKQNHNRNPRASENQFEKNDFDNGDFQTHYSEYLMGEIKDYLSFYYSKADYESFRKCFDFLEGKSNFNYDVFLASYKKMGEYFNNNNLTPPQFFETADSFLQFLFELNVICYIEVTKGKQYIHWCFKERNYANLSPKVRTGCRYEIHYGLLKSLNFGQRGFGTYAKH